MDSNKKSNNREALERIARELMGAKNPKELEACVKMLIKIIP